MGRAIVLWHQQLNYTRRCDERTPTCGRRPKTKSRFCHKGKTLTPQQTPSNPPCGPGQTCKRHMHPEQRGCLDRRHIRQMGHGELDNMEPQHWSHNAGTGRDFNTAPDRTASNLWALPHVRARAASRQLEAAAWSRRGGELGTQARRQLTIANSNFELPTVRRSSHVWQHCHHQESSQ